MLSSLYFVTHALERVADLGAFDRRGLLCRGSAGYNSAEKSAPSVTSLLCTRSDPPPYSDCSGCEVAVPAAARRHSGSSELLTPAGVTTLHVVVVRPAPDDDSRVFVGDGEFTLA